MRILVVTTFNDRPETAVLRGLVQAGVDVDMICHPDAPEKQTLADGGIGVSSMLIRHRFDLAAARGVRAHLLRRPPDILYAPRNGSLSVSLVASRGINVKRVAYRGTIGHLSRLDPASWLTYFHPRVDCICCVSEAVRRYLLSKRLPPGRLVTIYKGHDPDWYAGEPDIGRAELGLPADAFVVGFIGSIRPVKGVGTLIHALARLPRDLNAHALLVGELRDPSVPGCVERLSLRDRVHFAGFHREGSLLAKRCDVLVTPSLEREGLPRAVIEAMSQAVPVVVTNVGGLPELVVHEACGLVVPPGDPVALAAAIRRLAEDPERRREIGQAGRERIRAHFNVRTTTERTLALYRELRGTADGVPASGGV